jgi:glutamate dehydrogenase (NAD(P)+)
MGKRFEEASNERILRAVEQLTSRHFPHEIFEEVAAGAGEEDLVNSGLEDTMAAAYDEIRTIRLRHDTDLRTAAFINAIEKVARAYLERGIFP